MYSIAVAECRVRIFGLAFGPDVSCEVSKREAKNIDVREDKTDVNGKSNEKENILKVDKNESVLPAGNAEQVDNSKRVSELRLEAQRQLDRYLDKFSMIDVTKSPVCNSQKRQEYRSAVAHLDALNIVANQLGADGESYSEFIKNRKGDIVWIEPLDFDAQCASEAIRAAKSSPGSSIVVPRNSSLD